MIGTHVIPAEAGIQKHYRQRLWTPVCAGAMGKG